MKKYQKPELFTPSKEEVSAAAKRLVVESVSKNTTGMNKKQEKIKEAYGQYWEEFKSYVDHNGRLKVLWTSIFYGITDEFKKLKELIEIADIEWEGEFYSIPKSLVGISDNNGWISISNESDFPTEDDCGYFLLKNGKPEYWYWPKHEALNSAAWLSVITHWQKIETPKPPIY